MDEILRTIETMTIAMYESCKSEKDKREILQIVAEFSQRIFDKRIEILKRGSDETV